MSINSGCSVVGWVVVLVVVGCFVDCLVRECFVVVLVVVWGWFGGCLAGKLRGMLVTVSVVVCMTV